MTMESPVRFVGGSGASMWPPAKEAVAPSPANLPAHDLELLLKGHGLHGNRRDTAPSRSGSAPPSMEGSLAALGNYSGLHHSSFDSSLLSTNTKVHESEEQLRADPSYIAYYLSNVNLNPRLPPPLKSRENRHLVRHVGRSGENWRLASFDDSSKGYLLSSQAPLSTHKEEIEDDRSPTHDSSCSTEKHSGFLSSQYLSSSEGRHKNIVDLIQEDFPRTPSPVFSNQSRLSSHGLGEELIGSVAQVNPLQDSSITAAKLSELGVCAGNSSQIMHTVEPVRNSDLLADPLPRMSLSERLLGQHVGAKRESNMEKKSSVTDMDGSNISKIAAEMRSLSISNEQRSQHSKQHFQKSNSQPRASATQLHASQTHTMPHSHAAYHSHNVMDQFSHGQSKISPSADTRPALQTIGYSAPLFSGATGYINPDNPLYPNLQPSSLFSSQYSIGGYAINASIAPPLFAAYPPPGAIPMALENPINLNLNGNGRNVAPGVDWQQLYKLYGQLGVPAQPSFTDPFYLNYFQQPSPDAYAAAGQYDSMTHNYDLQKGLSSVLYPADQRPPYLGSGVNVPGPLKGGVPGPNYYGNPQHLGILMQDPPSSFGSPQLPGSPVAGAALPMRRNDNIRLPVSSSRNTGSYSGWQGQRGHERVDDPKTYSFLEELKSSKTRRFEFSDIIGRIVEFSTDQHGSRFIQQKLENCTVEEKACVFEEVLPHASMLMTDVFGNYVIQKFFEHGNMEQRKELANKLVGHILPLSLQMYGCRVIQKALEVIDDDQKTQLVRELDGHVMRCVRDQNGNHVIQKCIERVPTERIGFIISAFQGQVVTLSTHPYGCRVIQRVLEHCTDKLQSQCIVDEILQSACFLAQDQYGNYVTQHVLEKGKPQERSQIITKLAGQIVQMSQNKFASNVIEKCLEHGDYAERDLLIEEIVGQTEGNDNLLVMMKDQYANYVIQKILETCSDKQREILLTRIKVHVQALKKYTYGKHIVARLEQLSSEECYASSE